ncbi:hypothetical protein B6S08_13870 [Oceanimonas doudoroffii]|uniref:Uncharacterized protein n=1 Tax=Oceanimonas doudoroffii TaxID=84158 RepID=A0A233RCM5_9GAMM|nr:hypothetical protein B6S08_13870 [Oceanimonas doudoroffii]
MGQEPQQGNRREGRQDNMQEKPAPFTFGSHIVHSNHQKAVQNERAAQRAALHHGGVRLS